MATTTATTTTTTTAITANGNQEAHHCSHKHKIRLFVGEGNFSYTEALINKHLQRHPNLATQIIATELMTREKFESAKKGYNFFDDVEVVEPETETLDRIKRLEELGVQVMLGLDGTKLHEVHSLQGKSISRIHWNLPLNDAEEFYDSFVDTLGNFFRSCNLIQNVKDRVYITLLQNENKKAPQPNYAPDWIFQQGYKAGIVDVSHANNYKLIKKRKFLENDQARYLGYKTRNSLSGKELKPKQITCIREFIFEKQGSPVSGNDYTNTNIVVQTWTIKRKNQDPQNIAYYECNTDGDSSDYSISDEEKPEPVDNITEIFQSLTTDEKS